jgi:hypothetical protein
VEDMHAESGKIPTGVTANDASDAHTSQAPPVASEAVAEIIGVLLDTHTNSVLAETFLKRTFWYFSFSTCTYLRLFWVHVARRTEICSGKAMHICTSSDTPNITRFHSIKQYGVCSVVCTQCYVQKTHSRMQNSENA